MLHGHAKIELTNVKTGEKRVIEHDNYMTNWLKDILTPFGIYGDDFTSLDVSRSYGSGSSTTEVLVDKQSLFGGILLFEDALSNDAPNDYKFPLNNKCVARAWNGLYGGTDLTVGTFNSGLSEFDNEHATFVWDFTQERGNGTISALGLTNPYGAMAGSGMDEIMDSSIAASMSFGIKAIASGFGTGNQQQLPKCAWVDEENDMVYALSRKSSSNWSQDKYLVIWEQPLFTKYYNPITQKIRLNARRAYGCADMVKTELNMASYFNAIPAFAIYNGYAYLFDSGTWNSGSNRTLVKINLATKEITTQNVTNNTGISIWCGEYNSFAVYDGRLYMQSASNRYVYIDLTDNTDCGKITDSDGDELVTSGTGVGRFFELWGDLYFSLSGTNVTQGWNDTVSPRMLVLTAKNKAIHRNLDSFYSRYVYTNTSYCVSGGNRYRAYFLGGISDSNELDVAYNFMCLQTKNNLDSPVTKTSDMTMRVTYTIREATE